MATTQATETEGEVTINVSSFPASLKKEIQELAKADRRPMSGWIVKKLEEIVRAEKDREQQAA